MIGEDLKLLVKAIPPTTLAEAALAVAESKWMMADKTGFEINLKTREDWVDEQAAGLLSQLRLELNGV